jgi:sugar lactone lactonase YvrE
MKPRATRPGRFTITIAFLVMVMAGDVHAQAGSTLIADGLNGPMGVLVMPDGTVWVVDSGTGGEEEREGFDPVARKPTTVRLGETSRVIKIDPDGTQTVVHTLPSVLVTPTQVYGGDRLAMLDGVLYVTSGGWNEDNPMERSPLAAAVVRLGDGERTEVANTWDVERDENPDGTLRESNPYGLTAGPDGMLWVADAAANTLLKVDPASGALEVAAVFDGIESPLPNANRGGALESDPVPTAVAFDQEGNAYVSLLPGFPFLPGSARVVRVTPEGETHDYANGLTMLTDLRRGPDGELYAVTFGKFTEQGPVAHSGAIVRVHEGNASEAVVTGLSSPTSIDFNGAGDAFVTTNGAGPPGTGELRKFDAVAVRK